MKYKHVNVCNAFLSLAKWKMDAWKEEESGITDHKLSRRFSIDRPTLKIPS